MNADGYSETKPPENTGINNPVCKRYRDETFRRLGKLDYPATDII
jgi:hypothetical protein